MSGDLTISKLYKYKRLSPYVGLEGRIPIKHKDVYVGVEVELEDVSGFYDLGTKNFVEDHSLKIGGAEFVTIPIKMRYLEVELQRLFGSIVSTPTVSSRCSTHVHVNVRDMTVAQVLNMVMLYTIFERSLYRISGDRWLNNFCIPIQSAPETFNRLLRYSNKPSQWEWNKYQGLNLCPIWGGESSKIGTVEFRQLHGTTSVEEIIQWCNIITSLKRAAQGFDQEELLAHIRTMNTTSGYWWLVRTVFGRYSKLLTDHSNFAEDTERGITVLKTCIPRAMLGYKEEKTTKTSKPNTLKSIDVGVDISSLYMFYDELVKSDTPLVISDIFAESGPTAAASE